MKQCFPTSGLIPSFPISPLPPHPPVTFTPHPTFMWPSPPPLCDLHSDCVCSCASMYPKMCVFVYMWYTYFGGGPVHRTLSLFLYRYSWCISWLVWRSWTLTGSLATPWSTCLSTGCLILSSMYAIISDWDWWVGGGEGRGQRETGRSGEWSGTYRDFTKLFNFHFLTHAHIYMYVFLELCWQVEKMWYISYVCIVRIILAGGENVIYLLPVLYFLFQSTADWSSGWLFGGSSGWPDNWLVCGIPAVLW